MKGLFGRIIFLSGLKNSPEWRGANGLLSFISVDFGKNTLFVAWVLTYASVSGLDGDSSSSSSEDSS